MTDSHPIFDPASAVPSVRTFGPSVHQELERVGCTLLTRAIDQQKLEELLEQLGPALQNGPDSIKSRRGETSAARNLLETVPLTHTIWQAPPLLEFLTTCLGADFGLVRGLFFDKHPDRAWSLGWHKDMTIAVKDHQVLREKGAESGFSKPTRKSGVPHVEASEDLLWQMVTLRIHLDPVTEDNGPLEIIPGSHRSKQTETQPPPALKILAGAGDVLAMRPLISHASGSSRPGTRQHRRIVHLEFSGQSELPAGLEWFHFIQPGC